MNKQILFTVFLGLLLCGSVYAQSGVLGTRNLSDQGDRILTMEEAVLGYGLLPANKTYMWRGSLPELTWAENDCLMGMDVVTKKRDAYVVLTLDRINEAVGLKMRAFPRFSWEENNSIVFSAEGRIFKYDVVNNTVELGFKIPEGASDFTFAPSYEWFAYTRNNNLYICDTKGAERAITKDDDPNIVNGQSVSRNEFGIDGGIFWSPDASLLAYYRKDESAVGTFPLLDITSRTGTLREIKYPMAGMASEHISLCVYDIASGNTIVLDVTDFDAERYLTNISWTPDSENILIQVLDRSQKLMHLNMYSAATGKFVKKVLEEQNDSYVEPQGKLIFLKGKAASVAARLLGGGTKQPTNQPATQSAKQPQIFLYHTDNRDGYKNLYLCDLDGNVKRLTNTNADVSYAGADDSHIYYMSAEVSPIESHLFRTNLKTGKSERLTTAPGWHTCSVCGDGSWFIDNYSSLCVPRVINLTSTDGKRTYELLKADDPVKQYNYGEIVLGTVKSADGKFDNYYRLIKPTDFNPSKKYPVIVYVYGGPHSQMVQNTFLGQLRRWEMLMAQKGYVVYVQDNRGTSNRGAMFEKAIYGQCGQAEMADQMEGIKMLKSLPYVDGERIGVHGWSYGGFMTISLITNYPDVFKVGVAGGPVIDWKWYEVMYGERYMGSPLTNAAGYEKVSLIPRAKDLKGKLLICQGAIDNTVVWEHSLSFVEACINNLIQVDYFPYPCHEHNVRGRERIHLMDKVTLYFDSWL